jgi:transglutaminase-like putative cysteine protease
MARTEIGTPLLPGRLCSRLAFATLLVVSLSAIGADLSGSAAFGLPPKALYAAASSAVAPAGADVEVLEYREFYRFESDGSSVYTQYLVYKVLSPAGVENWNDLSIDWAPWRSPKPSLNARVITADGKIYPLDAATITDSPASNTDDEIYTDERTLRAPLPAIAVGAVVETEIALKETLPFPEAGEVHWLTFQIHQPVQHFQLTLQAPKSIHLRFRMDHVQGLSPVHSEDTDKEQWTFEYGPTGARPESEPGLPRDVYAVPTVTFATGESWQHVAAAYARIVDAQIAGSDLGELVQRLTRDTDSAAQKTLALVDYINREIRYTGIEFDKASVLPHTPAETLQHKYGDCKDKATLLVAMLRAAGVPADLALLNAGDRLDTAPDMPGMGAFDHAIVFLPGNPAVWIDATAETSRPGQLPADDQGRLALVVDTTTTSLTPVPESPSTDNVLYEERNVYLSDNGPARVVEVSRPRGTFEASYRRSFADLNNKSTKQTLTKYVRDTYVAQELDRVSRSDPTDLSQPFSLTLESDKAERGFTSLSEANVYIPLGALFWELPDQLKTREPTSEERARATPPELPRVTDYELARPFVAEWHYRIQPPPGFEPAALPADAQISLGPARLSEHFAAETDGTVQADIRFDTVKRRFSAQEHTAMRNAVADLRDADSVKVRFELNAQVLLNQGHPREAFELLRTAIHEHPGVAIYHLRRANALSQAGMGEEARTEARLAVKLDPKSALAERTLALILENDLIGRWRRTGADYAGATAAFRAAISLDPKNKSSVVDYAILQEYNDAGERYGVGSDLKGAIATFRTLSAKEQADYGSANNLPYALFYHHDFAAALDGATSLASPPPALVVACTALLVSAPAALTEARRRSSNDNIYADTLTNAGKLLISLREYSSAAALLEAGASGTTTSQTLGLAAILKKATPYEALHLQDTPEDFVRRLIIAMLGPGATLENLEGFESRNALAQSKAEGEKERGDALRMLKELRAGITRSGLPQQVIIDLSMQIAPFRTRGSDAAGYQVSLQEPQQKEMAFYLVMENGRLRLLATSDQPAVLAIEVLDRVAHQNVVGAAALLDLHSEKSPDDALVDPLYGSLFGRFWAGGSPAPDARAVSLAAAALLVQDADAAPQGIKILESFAEPEAIPGDQQNIHLALMTGYLKTKDYEKVLAEVAILAKHAGPSRRLFLTRTNCLVLLDRFKEAEDSVSERLRNRPDDLDALHELVIINAAQHHYAEAYELAKKAYAGNGGGAPELNQLAWLSLFFERSDGPGCGQRIERQSAQD